MPQRPKRAAVPPRSAGKLTGAFFCAGKAFADSPSPTARAKKEPELCGAALRTACSGGPPPFRARIIPSLPFDAEGTGFIRDVATFQVGEFSVYRIVGEQTDLI